MKYSDAENNQRLDRFYVGLLEGKIEVPEGATIERGVHCIFLSNEIPNPDPNPSERDQALMDVIELATTTQFYITQYELTRGLSMVQIQELPQYKRAEIYSRHAEEILSWVPREER